MKFKMECDKIHLPNKKLNTIPLTRSMCIFIFVKNAFALTLHVLFVSNMFSFLFGDNLELMRF